MTAVTALERGKREEPKRVERGNQFKMEVFSCLEGCLFRYFRGAALADIIVQPAAQPAHDTERQHSSQCGKQPENMPCLAEEAAA